MSYVAVGQDAPLRAALAPTPGMFTRYELCQASTPTPNTRWVIPPRCSSTTTSS